MCRLVGHRLSKILKCPDFPINQCAPRVRGVIGAVVITRSEIEKIAMLLLGITIGSKC